MLPISEFSPARMRALVVETNDDLRLTLCACLESLDVAASPARNGTAAIGALQARRHTFDIVLTDLKMSPGPSGLEVLKTARQVHPESYVIVMTGPSSIETAIRSVELGAFDYLAKPFRLEEIGVLTRRIREHAALRNENARLSRRLETLAERFAAAGSRLDRIESLLGRLSSNLLQES
jgi:two-component system response regulator PilR (NtrC family)